MSGSLMIRPYLGIGFDVGIAHSLDRNGFHIGAGAIRSWADGGDNIEYGTYYHAMCMHEDHAIMLIERPEDE